MPSRYLTSDNYVVDTLTVNGVTVTSGAIASYDPATVSGAVASGNAALVDANTAQASGNAALTVTTTALASGNAAISVSNDALASGNLALTYLVGASGVPGAWARMTAAVAITSGDAVGVNDQGTIEPTRTIAVAPSSTPALSSLVRITSNSIGDQSATAYNSLEDTFLTAYPDSSISDYGTCVAYKLTSSGTFDKGLPVVFQSTPIRAVSCDYSTVDNVFGVLYGSTASGIPTTVAVQTSGLFSFAGSPSTINGNFIFQQKNTALAYSQPANCFIGAYSQSIRPFAQVQAFSYSSSNSNNNVGTLNYTTSTIPPTKLTSNLYSGGYIAASTHPELAEGYVSVGGVFGLYVLRYGLQDKVLQLAGVDNYESTTVNTNNISKTSSVYDVINDRLVVGYVDVTASSACKAVVLDTSKSANFSTLRVGAATTVSSNSTDGITLAYDYPNARVHLAYSDASANDSLQVVTGSVSDLTISLGSATPVTNSSSYSYSSAYSTVQKKPVITFADSLAGNSLRVFSSSTGSGTQYYPQVQGSPNYVGVAQATVTGGQQVTVALSRSIDKNQTGLTPNRYQYIDYSVSGSFTATVTEPTYWPQDKAWHPVSQSINSSTVILLNSY